MESRPARRVPRAAIAGLLLLAAALRAGVVARVPDLYGPGDPGIYLAMARGWAHEGVPRVHFVHHLLTQPPAIAHLEDYYEPAFGLLLAGPLAASGGSPVAARLFLCACSVLTVALVWRITLRFGEIAAVVAALIVALEPWSVSYGGLLMKEAAVGLVLVLVLALLLRTLDGSARGARAALPLVAATWLAALVQYELLPVLGAGIAFALLARRRDALPVYVLGVAVAVAALAAITWRWLGVPISAKYLFFLGAGTGGAGAPPAARLAAFLPFEIVGRELLVSWHPILLLLAIAGALRSEATRRYALPWAAITGAALYFHGVPHDLWPRDFIPLTAIAAPLAGLALADRAGWRARPLGPALALAALTFALLSLFREPLRLPLDEGRRWFWPAATAALAGSAIVFTLAAAMRSSLARWRGAVPAVLAVALVASVWSRLPLPEVYRNPEFPGRDLELARIDRVSHTLVAALPPGPLIAAYPVEWHLATGWPTVRLPQDPRAEDVRTLRDRYLARYLLAAPEDLPDSILRRLPLRARLRSEEETLYEFLPR
jgi:hypothetical protein